MRKRTFILATILTPLALVLFMVIAGLIFSYEGTNKNRIAVVDEAGVLEGSNLKSAEDGSMYFIKRTEPLDSLKRAVGRGEFDGVLVIPPIKNLSSTRKTVYYYSDNQLSIDASVAVEDRLADVIREYKIGAFDLDKEILNSLRTRVTIDPQPLNDTDEDVTSFATVIGAGIGIFMGIIMYMAVFIYGMMVMRSVMEEKTSRIVEVMISSVRPFQLMMGKIIGVGAVGLTQVAIWGILMPILFIGAQLIFGFDPNQMDAASAVGSEINPEEVEDIMASVLQELNAQNWWMIITLFLFYFLGGYFLYASLFAAVGSAMSDDMGEGQTLTLPITVPVIIAFYIMIVAVRSPESNLAVWSSIFPLFSPIVMPSRLTFGPPLWQILLSMLLLGLTAWFFVWLSARIYRVGILMYGKKITLKELGKWMFYAD